MALTIGNALSELNRRQARDLDRRRGASTILSPEAVQGERGTVSAAKLLFTTLGGVMRPITARDLAQFRHNAAELGDRLQRGITAQEVIDHSLRIDIDRAKTEIRHAVPARLSNGTVHFVTGAGPESDVTRHFVTVKFPGYGRALSRPGTPQQAAVWLGTEAPLQFDCDCGRHTFWYRYLATAGGYNAGRAETGYPKIRNPELRGLACKHVLRVMVELLRGPLTRTRLREMIAADRARLDQRVKTRPRVIQGTRTDVERVMAGRVRMVATTDERNRRAMLSAIRTSVAQPKTPQGRELNRTLSALQARTDVPAAAILKALQSVLRQS